MSFEVLVGLSGFFLMLLSLGLICIDEVAREGGLIWGVLLFVLGVVLLFCSTYLL